MKGKILMSTQYKKEEFNKIYNNTYTHVLKYIAINCSNLEDINDILQDTYLELYKIIIKKDITISNEKAFTIAIARNKVKKYMSLKYKLQMITCLRENTEINNNDLDIENKIDIEQDFIDKENVSKIWEMLNKKNLIDAKIFYLYFSLGMKISEISQELKLNSSTVKNHIYRTLKYLKDNLSIGDDIHD